MSNKTYDLADIGTRFVAILIDGLIQGVITGALFGIGRTAGGGLGIIITLAYNWYFWTRNNGQTPGKSLMNIRVIKADGTPITDADAIVRAIGYYISGLVLGLGYIWAIFDANNQAWHDHLAKTYVVKVPTASE